MSNIGFRFGALCDPLEQQLREQGVRVCADGHDIETIQRMADAITLLVLQGVITDGECRKARTRLAKKIYVEPIEESK